jgi:hypothetical protein
VTPASVTPDTPVAATSAAVTSSAVSSDSVKTNTPVSIYNQTLYVDTVSEAVTDIGVYKSYGPNNEVYLKTGNAIFTNIKTDLDDATGAVQKPASVQIAARAANAKNCSMKVTVYNGAQYYENTDWYDLGDTRTKEFVINSSTDRYYDITDLFENQDLDYSKGVTISIAYGSTGDPDSILSLTNVKVTGTNAKLDVDNNTYIISRAFKAMKFQNAKTDTKVYSAKAANKTYKKGKKAKFTIKTSSNTKSLVIKKGSKNVKPASAKSVVNKDGTAKWTVTVKLPSKKGTYSYKVYAKGRTGSLSAAKTVKVKVK